MYPEYVEVDGQKYKINTDFRIAIECNRIAEDETINNSERTLAIIYILFGEEALNKTKNYQKLFELAIKYLKCGKEIETNNNLEPDMDYIQDMPYIKASFRSDYGIKLDEEKIHWWEFNELMNGLSNSEIGNCCILNRIRNLRNFNTKDIKDTKTRNEIEKAKREVALKAKKTKATKEQQESAKKFFDALGI